MGAPFFLEFLRAIARAIAPARPPRARPPARPPPSRDLDIVKDTNKMKLQGTPTIRDPYDARARRHLTARAAAASRAR